ncbi:hypothetical protein ACLE20_14320 [Rhizobium sp. YIM 134829]
MAESRMRKQGEGLPDPRDASYTSFMVRELAVWLIGVPVPIAALIGYFVL